MTTLYFNIINTAADLPQLHRLSDAGAGARLMHLTPTRDTEVIASGRAVTPFPGDGVLVQPVAPGLLTNGGISPAVLTHGLLQMMHSKGYQIEINSFNFGVPQPQAAPRAKGWQVNHYGGIHADTGELAEMLRKQLVCQVQQGGSGCSVLAECGVGGTTFSTLWLRGLTGAALNPAGSTRDPQKLAAKALLLEELEARHLNHGFNLERMLTTPGASDAVQQAICYLIRYWPEQVPMPWLAGGVMFMAPMLASFMAGLPAQACTLATTRWVLNGDTRRLLGLLPKAWNVKGHTTDFNLSRLACLHRYEQGEVVEGCGLGGVLVMAESLGFSQQQIIDAMDLAAYQHMYRAQRMIQQEAIA